MNTEQVASMLSLFPSEFDAALLGYAESGTGRAIVLPVYDKKLFNEILGKSEKYNEDKLSMLPDWEDLPLLLNRMSKEEYAEQSTIYDFPRTKYADAILGLIEIGGEEECWCYDLNEASKGKASEAKAILQFDLPGVNTCFLTGTSEEDLAIIKKKAYRLFVDDNQYTEY